MIFIQNLVKLNYSRNHISKNFSPVLGHHKRKLQTFTFYWWRHNWKWIAKIKKVPLRCCTSQHLVFAKNGVQVYGIPFFILSETENRIEKSCFIRSYGSLKIVCRYSNFLQKCWEVIGLFFQKRSWCCTTVPNFMSVAYHYPEINHWQKKTPSQAYIKGKGALGANGLK